MSKKHFIQLAAALKAEKPMASWAGGNKLVQWELDVKAIANVCANVNPNFDRNRFMAACGVGEMEVAK